MNAREKVFRETMNEIMRNLKLPNSPSKRSPQKTYTDPHHLALNRAFKRYSIPLPEFSPVKKSKSSPALLFNANKKKKNNNK